MMINKIIRITLLVRNQDEALRFYTEKLGFEKRTDLTMAPGQRWLTVASKGDQQVEIVLQPPDWFEGTTREDHLAQVGKNPTLVFQVDDCRRIYAELRQKGVEFASPPENLPYGIQAVAKDLYSNDLVLLELPKEAP
jgi:catechol 2,3-dioxygenase-like lactoylglutathione lyase family enzyme